MTSTPLRRLLVAAGIVATGALIVPLPCSAQAPPRTEPSSREITLVVGETSTLPAVGIKNYSEGAPGIVDVRLTPEGNKFVLIGRKPGTTQLLLIKNDGSQVTYDITVSTRATGAVESELQLLLRSMPGVTVRRVGSRFFLEGAVPSQAEAKRLDQITALYAGQVESLVAVGQDRRILVRLDLFFVQYEKTSGYAVGLGWPDSIGGTGVVQNAFTYDFVAGTTTTATASVANQPLPRLDIASRKGWAKILKQSTVITGNGLEAVFESGGEQNFINSTGLSTALVKVAFGTNVTVLPRFDTSSKDIDLKLLADVSDLTAPVATGGPPGRTTTKLQTSVTLRLGQALILSGIRTQTQRQTLQGLPLLSEIPILGALFGSRTNSKEDVEGAIFVVPSVVETVPKSAREQIRSALDAHQDYAGEIGTVNSFPRDPPSAK